MGWTDFDLDIMALTVWAEARGEGDEGMAAVVRSYEDVPSLLFEEINPCRNEG